MDNSSALIEELEAPHKHHGRRGYSMRGLLRVYALQFLLKERYSKYFLNRLDGNPDLIAICGLEQAPTESTYCRFKKKLAPKVDLVDSIFDRITMACAGEIERLREADIVPAEAPRLGETAAVDATDIESYANTRKKPSSDSGATWGYRTPKKGSRTAGEKNSQAKGERKEFFLGYKGHAIVDAYHQIPLYMKVRTAQENEGPHFRADLDSMLERLPWARTRYLSADKAYAALYNFQHAASRGILPIIAVPRPPRDRTTGKRRYEGIYDEEGRPTCIGGQSMRYLGTDEDGFHHFRCPEEGCALKEKVDWSRYCDFEHSEKPEGKLLRIMGIIPRFGKEWERLYRTRPTIERWFSSDKRSRLLNQQQHLDQERVNLHAAMSTLTFQLTVLTRLMADDYEDMRHMYIRLPQVLPTGQHEPAEVALAETRECDDCCLCPKHGKIAV